LIRALVVEDDSAFARRCAALLLGQNIAVDYCSTAEQAAAYLLDHTIEFAVIDLRLPPKYKDEGIKLLEHLSRRCPSVRPIMMTAKQERTTELVAQAMRIGANHFLDKESDNFDEKLILCIKEIVMEQKRSIFLSHGHSELLKLKLKDFIQSRLNRSVLILADQPSRGLTVVEKLEQASGRCCFAVILLTKDDEQKGGGMRARQNVIHEVGFFQGKYGRKNVVLLCERGVELFSNISGIIRVEFQADSFEEVYEPLRIEVEAADGVT